MNKPFRMLLWVPLTVMLTHCSIFSVFGDDHDDHTVVGMHPTNEVPMALPPGSTTYHHTIPQQQHRTLQAAPVQSGSTAAPTAPSSSSTTTEPMSTAAPAAPAAPAVSFGAMDSVDHTKRNQALQSSRTNDTTSWHNPNTDVTYALTPTDTYKNNQGQTCRKYTLVKSKSGVRRMSVQQACRSANGSWGG